MSLYPACSTNADCLPGLYLNGNISGPLNWCIQAINCDPHYGTCTTWSRCTSWWYWGCLSTEQKCASWWYFWPLTTNGNTVVTVTHWTTATDPAVLIPAILFGLVFLIMTGTLIYFMWPLFYCGCGPGSSRRRRRQQEENVQVPMVSMDSRFDPEEPGTTTTSTATVPHHLQTVTRRWTTEEIHAAYENMTLHL